MTHGIDRRRFALGLAGVVVLPSCARARSPHIDAAARLAAIEKVAGGRLGAFILDTRTGRGVGWRTDERFAHCSTFKLSLAALVLREADAGRLKLAYAWQLGAADAGLFVAGRYVGHARISFDPGLARSMGGYWTVDAGLTLSRAPWRAALTVSNLLDGKGDSFGFGNPFSFRTERQRTPIRPRTLAFRIERKF